MTPDCQAQGGLEQPAAGGAATRRGANWLAWIRAARTGMPWQPRVSRPGTVAIAVVVAGVAILRNTPWGTRLTP